MTLHYIIIYSCLISIRTMVHFIPHITGQYHPLHTLNNLLFVSLLS